MATSVRIGRFRPWSRAPDFFFAMEIVLYRIVLDLEVAKTVSLFINQSMVVWAL
jgi:hypothetical protein